MKTKVFTLFAVVAILAFTSCDKMKTDKFDGTYKCYTTSDSNEEDLQLVIDDFRAIIDMQSMEIEIDGSSRANGVDVDNDGAFRATVAYNLLITEVDIVIEGTVDEDGNMSGTISETQDVIGIDMPVRYGTFSGSLE